MKLSEETIIVCCCTLLLFVGYLQHMILVGTHKTIVKSPFVLSVFFPSRYLKKTRRQEICANTRIVRMLWAYVWVHSLCVCNLHGVCVRVCMCLCACMQCASEYYKNTTKGIKYTLTIKLPHIDL